MIRLHSVLLVALLAVAPGAGQTTAEIDAYYPELQALYQDIHRNPELAFQEVHTAAKLAARLKALGFDVTTGVGRTGIVALLKNGAGPTVMLRVLLPGDYEFTAAGVGSFSALDGFAVSATALLLTRVRRSATQNSHQDGSRLCASTRR